MQFYLSPPSSIKKEDYFSLNYDKWDDYSYKTSFVLYFHSKSNTITEIGSVKILHKTEKSTINVIPKDFQELPEDFCSLGQEIEYYEKLKSLFPSDYLDLLDNLNDAAFFPAVREVFENIAGFKDSLLRSSEAEKALNEAELFLSGVPITKAFEFTYTSIIPGADKPHVVAFNFSDTLFLPNRIIALIGKNGTGKTQFMAKLALDLGGKGRKKRTEEMFVPHRPFFSKIIAISYSAFDKFARPSKNKSVSYKYCGLKDDKGFISAQRLLENYKEAVEKIVELDRLQEWRFILSAIIGEDVAFYYYSEIFENNNYEVLNQNNSRLLSSGQSFLMYVITEVIANIRKDSLLLFDEPEMHLHPDAIANLIRMIDRLLTTYDSYALLATHSPIILQEIPSRYVYVFDREGNVPRVRKLGTESFGENIEALTEEVFQTKNVQGTYKEVLKNLSNSMTYEQVLQLFDGRLSLNAKTYLAGLYSTPDTDG